MGLRKATRSLLQRQSPGTRCGAAGVGQSRRHQAVWPAHVWPPQIPPNPPPPAIPCAKPRCPPPRPASLPPAPACCAVPRKPQRKDQMTDALAPTGADIAAMPWIERLLAFDTTSRNSNLGLIETVRDHLRSAGVEPVLTHHASGAKANLFA